MLGATSIYQGCLPFLEWRSQRLEITELKDPEPSSPRDTGPQRKEEKAAEETEEEPWKNRVWGAATPRTQRPTGGLPGQDEGP